MAVTTLVVAMLLAANTATPQSPLPLGELPTQVLAPNECALVLWERATGRRIAMLTLRPDAIRVAGDGGVIGLPRTSADGELVAGFPARAHFSNGTISIITSLAIVANDSAGSGIVRDGVISVTGSDQVEVVSPVAGLAGCSR